MISVNITLETFVNIYIFVSFGLKEWNLNGNLFNI